MRKWFVLPVLALALASSCSNDKGDGGDVSLEGTWDAVAFEIDDATATEDELLARDFMNILTARDCFILSVTFNSDGTAISENKFDYLDLSGVAVGDFNIPCPTDSDAESGTYEYQEGQLSFTDSMGATSTVDARISGNRLYMDLAGSVFEDVVSTGQLVFEKR